MQDHYSEAINKLKGYLAEAKNFGEVDANCGYMATTNAEGQPSVRIITIHEFTVDGLTFIANKNSGKIVHLTINPKIGLCFYWDSIKMQITIEGIVEALNDSASNTLWAKREHNAKISAWVADIAKEGQYSDSGEHCKETVKAHFRETPPPIAESWQGFNIKPNRMEFWHTQWKSNKKRECFSKRGGHWLLDHFY